MFKIAFCAGHYLGTPGKRLPKQIDATETREWTLNDRVACFFAEEAEKYEDVELIRTDDPTGGVFIDIPQRTAVANACGADLYLDIHHNAAGRVFNGGGVEVFSYPGSVEGKTYRDAIYSSVIAAGGLKGNRSNPCQEKAFDSLRLSNMPAVLIECGYMDSTVDAPVILTEAYAILVAVAMMAAIAKVKNLKKKSVVPVDKDKNTKEKPYTKNQFIRDVQRSCGASVDGIPGPETLAKTVTVSEHINQYHLVVRPIQRWLKELGYPEVGEADGIAGVKFTAAVCAFQKANKCWEDGEITKGNKTWRKLLGME